MKGSVTDSILYTGDPDFLYDFEPLSSFAICYDRESNNVSIYKTDCFFVTDTPLLVHPGEWIVLEDDGPKAYSYSEYLKLIKD